MTLCVVTHCVVQGKGGAGERQTSGRAADGSVMVPGLLVIPENLKILPTDVNRCCAMLCYAMLCYAVLCYCMLCCAMLCYAMICYVVLCYDIFYPFIVPSTHLSNFCLTIFLRIHLYIIYIHIYSYEYIYLPI